MKLKHLAAVVAAAALVAGTGARADILYDNLAAVSADVDPVREHGPLADSFSTGGGAFNLSTVTVLVEGSAGDGGRVTLALLSDNGTSPGSVLRSISFSDSLLSPPLSPLTFALSGLLSAHTRYWLQLSSTDSSLQWSWSDDTSGPGVAGEYFANRKGVFPNTDAPYQMTVNAAPVPEVATWALMIAGVAGAGLALRRKGAAAALAA